VFEQIPDLAQVRFGVEVQITRFCRHYRVSTETVYLQGLTHPMKEEKLGLLRGWASRGRMYYEILRIMVNPRAPRKKAPRWPRLRRRLPRSGVDPSHNGLLSKLNERVGRRRQP
jgi:hypothetical protein